MTTALLIEEAVPLAYALVDSLCRDAGIRALAIKGPVPAARGLRTERQSVDVDVLVDPVKINDLEHLLNRHGWHRDGFYDTPGIIPRHAETFRHALWPCELDLHVWFPGMLADRIQVFDRLWSRRTTVLVANRDVTVGDRAVNAVISALNLVRSGSAGAADLAQLIDVCRAWQPADLDDLAELAAAVGAAESLEAFLAALGREGVRSSSALIIPLQDWETVTQSRLEVLPWLVGLRRERWWRRPAFVWRAIWLEDDRFRAWNPVLASSPWGVTKARWMRLKRGVAALPRALHDYRRWNGGDDGG